MQRAGFQALHILLMQPVHMNMGITTVGDIKTLFGAAQTAGTSHVVRQENQQD